MGNLEYSILGFQNALNITHNKEINMIKLIISILTVVKYNILNIYQKICPFILILNRNIFTFTTCLELPTSSEKGISDKYITHIVPRNVFTRVKCTL